MMDNQFKNTLDRLTDSCTAMSSIVEKGRALEDLIKYVFGQVPGLTYWDRNQVDIFKSQEIDLGFFNDSYSFLPHVLLVECKNWHKPVGSEEVYWFDAKVKLGGLDLGIFVAANGVTGDAKTLTSSHRSIAQALVEKRRLLIFTLNDFQAINSPAQVVDLIKKKLCDLHVHHTSLA